ncbi:MAG: hypothetical protein JKY32_07960 [Rhizobiales bacterium]|nr:hypothetical protein [Hyphomicrobiales bacterium]
MTAVPPHLMLKESDIVKCGGTEEKSIQHFTVRNDGDGRQSSSFLTITARAKPISAKTMAALLQMARAASLQLERSL